MKFNPLIVLVCVACTAVGAAAAEPSVTCLEGVNPEPIPIGYGSHTVDCAVDESTDSDAFTFQGIAGERVLIAVDGISNNLDPVAELHGPSADRLARDVCTGQPNSCSIVLEVVLEESGLHTITVEDSGRNEPGLYRMQLERVFPPRAPVVLEYDEPHADLISPSTDFDFFSFPVKNGTRVEVVVDGITKSYDPRIQIRDSSGVSLASDVCTGQPNSCSVAIELDVPKTEIYSVRVSDSSTNEDGDYQISVNCLVGACPQTSETITAIIERPTCEGVGGVSNIQGLVWTDYENAQVERLVEVIFDEGAEDESRLDIPCCSSRGDAPELMSGFSGVFNWCLLDPGLHTITLVFTSTTGETLRVTREFVSHCAHTQDSFVRQGEFDWANGGDRCDSFAGGVVVCEPDPGLCDGQVRYEWTQASQGLALRSDCVANGLNPPAQQCSDQVLRESGNVFDE